jgi:hypothetical protein
VSIIVVILDLTSPVLQRQKFESTGQNPLFGFLRAAAYISSAEASGPDSQAGAGNIRPKQASRLRQHRLKGLQQRTDVDDICAVNEVLLTHGETL